MPKIYVQPPDYENFDAFLKYARKYGYSLEIASFAYGDVLDGDWQKILKRHQKKLQNFKETISLHGAFQDIIIHSSDKKIKKVATDRIIQNLEIAKALDAKYVVFHASFNPLIRHERYEKNWVERNANFWSEVLDKYHPTILLENLWEQNPEIFRKLLDTVKSPRFKICFDTGHANIFSKVPFEEWINVLGEDIPYMHINDNKGDFDNELVPGDGTINWQEFSDTIGKHGFHPDIALEVGTIEKTKRSIEYFRKGKIYPFSIFST